MADRHTQWNPPPPHTPVSCLLQSALSDGGHGPSPPLTLCMYREGLKYRAQSTEYTTHDGCIQSTAQHNVCLPITHCVTSSTCSLKLVSSSVSRLSSARCASNSSCKLWQKCVQGALLQSLVNCSHVCVLCVSTSSSPGVLC